MTKAIEQVREFNTAFSVPMSETPTTRVPAAGLRYELIREEFEELGEAIENLDIVEIADALGDIVYVAYGAVLVFGLENEDLTSRTAHGVFQSFDRERYLSDLRHGILFNDTKLLVNSLSWISSDCYELADELGIELDEIIDAIHKSNMTKLGENGEVLRRPEDNKVIKGPNYKTPTDDIRKLVFGDNYAPTGE